MSVDPLAPSNLAMQGPSQGFMASMEAIGQGVRERVDAIGDMLVGAFDKMMTKGINEGGLADMAGKVGAGLASGTNKLGEGIAPNSLRGPSKSNESPAQEQAVQQQAGLPDHVKTQALAAMGSGSTGVGMPTIQASNMQNIDMSQQISPPVTYGIQTQTQGMGIG